MPSPGDPEFHAALTQLENLRIRHQVLREKLRLHIQQRPTLMLPSRARLYAQRQRELEQAVHDNSAELALACTEVGIREASDDQVALAWKRHLDNRRPAVSAREPADMNQLFSEHDLEGEDPQPGESIPAPPQMSPVTSTDAGKVQTTPQVTPMSSLLRNLQAHDTSQATTYTERGAYGRPALTMPLQMRPPDLQQWIGTRLDANYRHEPVVRQLVRISTIKARPSPWQPAPVSPSFTTGELSSLLWWRERLIQGEEVEEDPNAALMIGLSLCLGIGGRDDEESLNDSFDLLTRLWKRHNTDHAADTTLSMWCNHFLALYRPDTELARAWHKRHMRFSANPGGLEIWLRHVDQPITRGAWRHCTQPSIALRAKMSPESREVLDQMEKQALEITGRWMARTGRLDNLLSGPLGSDDTMVFGGTGYIGNIYYRQRMRAQLKLLPVTLKDAAKVPQSQMRRALKIGSSRPHVAHADLMDELTSAGEQMLRDSGLIVEKTPKPRKKKAAPEPEPAAAPEPIQVDLARVQALEEDSARIRSRLLDTNDLAHLGVEADFSWSLETEEFPAPERDPEQETGRETPSPEPGSAQTAEQNATPQPDCASGGADLTPVMTAIEADSGQHATLSAAARSLLKAARETPGLQPGRQWEGEQLDDLMDEINTLALNEIGDVLLMGDGSGLQLEASYEAFAQTLEDRQ